VKIEDDSLGDVPAGCPPAIDHYFERIVIVNESKLAVAVEELQQAAVPGQRGAIWTAIEKVLAKLAALGKKVPVSEIVALLEQAGVPAALAPVAAAIVESLLGALSSPPATTTA
jgi:hypothetical protein